MRPANGHSLNLDRARAGGPLIAASEHDGELEGAVARSDGMTNEAPEPLLPLGDFRPSRADDAPAAEGTAALLTDVAADPECAPPRLQTRHAGDALTTLTAVSVHALALFALLSAPATKFGGGGRSLDAISVSIVPATALESREAVPPVTPGAASGFVAPTEGEDAATAEASPDKQADAKPQEHEPEREPPRDQIPHQAEAAAPEPAPAEAPAVAAEPTPPLPVEEQKTALADPLPRPQEPADAPSEEIAETPLPEARQAGGQASRGIAPELPPAAAAAAAAAGDVHAYGLAVQEALLAVDQSEVRTRKTISRTRGTAVVRFAVRPDGRLESAGIATSSGWPELDEAAVALVRLTTFPPPPPGLSDSQRTYVAPIVFK